MSYQRYMMDKLLANLNDEELEAINDILRALEYAKKKHPDPWDPIREDGSIDMIHAAAIVSEEAGELIRDAVTLTELIRKTKLTPSDGPIIERHVKMRKEAAQTGCTAIRFLANTRVSKV